jgi:hypothetical protein
VKPGQHSTDSDLRERIVEHLIIGKLLQRLWIEGTTSVEILRSEFDRGGYDLVADLGGVTRHIQLKCSRVGGSTADQTISLNLAAKPAGCVIWIILDDDLNFDHFLWFGGGPNERLPDIEILRTAKHSKGNALGVKLDRPNLRKIARNRFERVNTLEGLLDKLFGAAWTQIQQLSDGATI